MKKHDDSRIRISDSETLTDCTGTQCSVVNLQCDVTDIENEAGFQNAVMLITS